MTNIFSILEKMERLWEAATWRVRADEKPSIQISEEFLGWRAGAGNRHAYSRVEHVWEALEEHKAAPEILVLRRKAFEGARAAAERSRTRRSTAILTAVAAAMLIAVFAVENLSMPPKPAIYSTGIGERKIVQLDDGSRIALDASSTVVVKQFSKRVRELDLTKGRARFDVAHDKTRPFTVASGGEVTLAVGTSFDVESLDSGIVVTLRQGRVMVRSESGAVMRHPPINLKPGQALTTTRDGHATVQDVNLHAASAWETGKIVLNDQAIGDAVQQFNRYLDKPILVDPAVASMHVSGVFSLADANSFVSALTNYLPIQSHVMADNKIYLEKRGS